MAIKCYTNFVDNLIRTNFFFMSTRIIKCYITPGY